MEECLLYTLELCCNDKTGENKDRNKSVDVSFRVQRQMDECAAYNMDVKTRYAQTNNSPP